MDGAAQKLLQCAPRTVGQRAVLVKIIFPLLATIPTQLASYYMSVMRGYDPDFPRNLSKTLTVD